MLSKIPSSVYRLQFGKDMTFKEATDLIPYFQRLGVEGIYGSPIFASFMHGYDVTDPRLFNEKIGSFEEFLKFIDELHANHLFFVLDLVPNHMSIKGGANPWFMDVLLHGENSPFAPFFDIHWEEGKIHLPILRGSLEHALETRELRRLDENWIQYFDFILPIAEDTRSLTLQKLIPKQVYRLSDSARAGETINYRRFFNIDDLIGICIEKEVVFSTYHELAFKLIDKGLVDGIRIDHVDGMKNPRQYFERMAQVHPGFIWVEKILASNESLCESWNVDGTVGYEFLNQLNGLFIHPSHEESLTKVYHQFIEKTMDFEQILYERKKKYVQFNMSKEVDFFAQLLQKSEPEGEITHAIIEILASFPVYRTYLSAEEKRPEDTRYIEEAIAKAKIRAPNLSHSIFEAIKKGLFLETDDPSFGLRFQQFTAPVMAKGLEDSTFYHYNRLLSLNEVGSDPTIFGRTKEEFHQFNQERCEKFPYALLTTSTHDSKYSEDARQRLNVLSEMPDVWQRHVLFWKKINSAYGFSDLNMQYYLYQMLLAIFPADLTRIWKIFRKALREAGVHTSWSLINHEYETAALNFLRHILQNQEFLSSFIPFQMKISKLAIQNSLAAMTLKVGSCGVVDLYQGSERFNYTLVDPDNRVPVNFHELHQDFVSQENEKIQLTTAALKFRKSHKALFLSGKYTPLQSDDTTVAFARSLDQEIVLILASRFPYLNSGKKTLAIPKDWESYDFQDIYTERSFSFREGFLDLSECFSQFPCAILHRQFQKE